MKKVLPTLLFYLIALALIFTIYLIEDTEAIHFIYNWEGTLLILPLISFILLIVNIYRHYTNSNNVIVIIVHSAAILLVVLFFCFLK